MAQLRAWLTIAHGAGAHTTRAEGSRVRQRAGRSLRSPGIRGGLRAEARTRRRGSLAGPVHNLEGSAHQETQPADGRSRSMTSEFQPNNKEAIKARPGLPGAGEIMKNRNSGERFLWQTTAQNLGRSISFELEI